MNRFLYSTSLDADDVIHVKAVNTTSALSLTYYKGFIMLSIKGFLAVAIASASLSACYVVPLQQYPAVNNNYGSSVSVAPIVVPRPIYTARLYPVNESASSMGRIAGTISNPERGHGEFSFSVGSETFAGEATRAPNSAKGTANAAGNRGGFVKCDYTMSSSALGSGTCQFSSGARYDMHISP